MANMKLVGKRLDQGLDADEAFLEKTAGTKISAGPQPNASADSRRSSRLKIAGGVGGSCLLVALMLLARMGNGHTVAGRVLLDRAPVGDAEVTFHPAADAGTATRTISSADGSFSVAGLPAGSYAITLRPAGDGGPDMPADYAAPETTRFRITLARDLDNVTLYATRRPQPQR